MGLTIFLGGKYRERITTRESQTEPTFFLGGKYRERITTRESRMGPTLSLGVKYRERITVNESQTEPTISLDQRLTTGESPREPTLYLEKIKLNSNVLIVDLSLTREMQNNGISTIANRIPTFIDSSNPGRRSRSSRKIFLICPWSRSPHD